MTDKIFPLYSITGASIKSTFNTRICRSQSGYRQATSFGGAYWQISIELLRKSRQEHDEIFAFLNARRGRYESFKIIIPYYSSTKTNYKGEIKVDLDNQSGRIISVYGMEANKKILATGDFIRFSGHKKVYQIEEDLYSDSNGCGYLTIIPNLIQIPIKDETIIYNDVDFTVANTKDEISLNLDLHKKASWALEFEEVFN